MKSKTKANVIFIRVILLQSFMRKDNNSNNKMRRMRTSEKLSSLKAIKRNNSCITKFNAKNLNFLRSREQKKKTSKMKMKNENMSEIPGERLKFGVV